MMQKRKWLLLAGVGVLVGAIGMCSYASDRCLEVRWKYGLNIPQCPDGEFRLRGGISAADLRRGSPGQLSIQMRAHYTEGDHDQWETVFPDVEGVELDLVSAGGEATRITPKDGWKRDGASLRGEVVLPAVRDGDYILRALVHSKLGDAPVDLPVPLYAPARVHVLTDRPLYEPGNTIQFRALVVRARDLSPIDQRPGRWEVRDPTGELLLEEKAPAGEWGVVAGSFPLDKDAPSGRWSVAWRSGDAYAAINVTVEPFTLPRFRVDVSAQLPFYGAGDTPEIEGAVVYSSGAPVADADIKLDWTVSGDWPAPTSWMQADSGLPKSTRSKPNGRFKLTLPTIPADLQGRVVLSARVVATDPAGDRVESGTSVLLSEDRIQAEAQTNLGDGLVQGFNNRVYLRVTSADGRALSGANIKVVRAWFPSDEGLSATLDEDGVGRVQMDPGPPVSILIPPAPVRAPLRAKNTIVRFTKVSDLLSQGEPSMKDMVALEQWLAPLERCAKYVGADEDEPAVAMHINSAGVMVASMATNNRAAACALAAMRGRRLPAGNARFYTIALAFNDRHLPSLEVSVDDAVGETDDIQQAFAGANSAARDCLPNSYEGDLDEAYVWQLRKGQRVLTGTWSPIADSDPVPAGVTACVKRSLQRLTVDDIAEGDSMGVATFSVTPAQIQQEQQGRKPQPTIMVGYELLVTAEVAGKVAGQTKIRMQPGTVPPLRMRATPVLAKAGQEVTLELIRGPDYSGDVPESLTVSHDGNHETVKVDKKTRSTTFNLPKDASGWFEFEVAGARALVYAQGGEQLAVSVKPEKPAYRPGEQAKLLINTQISGVGASAGVGLFGVDQSLGQLAPLLGVDALAELRPQAVMSSSALGGLDAQALVMGRIRGAVAAEATIMRVGSIPSPAEIDVAVSGSAETAFDPVADTVPRFYAVLEELYRHTHTWESAAKNDEKMQPETMVKLWNQALAAVEKTGGNVHDAFGRRMRLHRLPDDLLELADPRQVVSDGARLPEDVENWVQWVKERRPK